MTGDVLKLAVKVGQGSEPTLKADLGNIQFAIHQQFAGVSNPYLGYKFGKRFIGAGFKIAAESRRGHTRQIGNVSKLSSSGK